jgi:hypothetical protein
LATKRPTVAGLQKQIAELIQRFDRVTGEDFCDSDEDADFEPNVPPPPKMPSPESLLPQPPENLGVYAVKDGKFTFRRMVTAEDVNGAERAAKAEKEVERLKAQIENLKAEKEQLRGVVQYLEDHRD